jgi:signal peptidase I
MDLYSHTSTIWLVIFLIGMTCIRASLSIADKRQDENRRDPRLRTAGEVLESFIIAVVLVFLVVRPFVAQAFYIPSESMTPTLTENDRILVNKLCYRVGAPKRHEVVVFRAPREAVEPDADGEEKDFVKRIVGLPGDGVEIHGGHVYINGTEDREPYGHESPQYDLAPFTVPDGKLFVMGDNRNHSNDSHRWGALDKERLIGRAMVIFWPPDRAGVIR